MNERLKQLRKAEELTQEEFAKRLGMNKNYVYLMEAGHRPVSDKTVKEICQAFNVNEIWLRTGAGEMRTPKTKQSEIADITARLFKMDSDSKQYKFIVALSEYLLQLDEKEMQSMLDLIRKLSDAVDDQGE